MKKNNLNIQSTLREINELSKLLKEAYVFDDEEEQQIPQEEEEYMPQDEDEMMMQDGQTEEIVDEIRKLALDGIQKYADDVDNENYILFKKIWMMCDKCISEKDKISE